MIFNNLNDLHINGFVGFIKISDLMHDISSIPKSMGVYLVLNLNGKPEFVVPGTGGYFKGKDPNVPKVELESKWVDNTIVVYIGKAGAEGISATLQSRINLLLRFGQRRGVGHWGGRYIWQLSGAKDLVVCWKPLTSEDPRIEEAELIQKFFAFYSKRPFANLIG